MLLDAEQIFSEEQAETTIAEHDSTNVLDLVADGDAVDPLYLIVKVDETVTSAGAATVQVKLETCATEDGTYTELLATSAIPKATLVEDYEIIKARIPYGCLRYLKVTYTIAEAALTAGKFSAFLVPSTEVDMPD